VRNWKRLQFPKVTLEYGGLVRYEQTENPPRELQQAVADDIFARIRGLYAGLEQHGRQGIAQRLREQRREATPPAEPAAS
jgi:1-acyl-sn-glycerol-3-phosphate acyltransferase